MCRIFFMLFLFSVILSSCSREDFVGEWEEEVEVPPSEEVDVSDINGIVRTNNGELISNVLVKLFSENELISETRTELDGSFEFFDLIEGESYFLHLSKDSYLVSIVSLDQNDLDSTDPEFVIIESSAGPYSSNDLDPSSSDVVLIRGSLLDEDDNGLSGKLIYDFGDGIHDYVSYVDEGDFSFLIETGSQVSAQFKTECNSLIDVFFSEGPFSENSYLGEYTVVDPSGNLYFEIEVLDCFTHDHVDFAEVSIFGPSGELIDVAEVLDGELIIELPECTDDLLFLEISDEQNLIGYPLFPEEDFSEGVILFGCDPLAFPAGEISVSIAESDSLIISESYAFLYSEEEEIIHIQGYGLFSAINIIVDVEESISQDEYLVEYLDIFINDAVQKFYFGEDQVLILDEEIIYPSGMGPGRIEAHMDAQVYDGIGEMVDIEITIDVPIIF